MGGEGGGAIQSFNKHENIQFDNEEGVCVYELLKSQGEWLWPWFGYASHLVQIECFIS